MATRMIIYILYVITQISTSSRTNEREEQFEGGLNPVIIPSLGVALKPAGLLASGADSLFASIFLSVPIPKTHKSECKRSSSECKPKLSLLTDMLKSNPSRFSPIIRPKENDETKLKHILRCITECINDKSCQSTMISNSECSNYETKDNSISEENIQINMDSLGKQSSICNNLITEPEISKIYRETMDVEIEDLWSTSYTAYNNLMRAYSLKANANATESRKKRGALMAAATLGLPLVSIATTIFNGIQLRRHIRKLEENFNHFAKESTIFMKQQVQFNEQIIEIHQALFEHMEEMDCELDIVAYQILKEKPFRKWKYLTKSILTGILQNELTMEVLPEVIAFQYLERLVQRNEFDNTIYQNQPELIYTQGKLTLVDLQRGETAWKYHFVLTAPKLKETSVFNRYSVTQVGVKIKNTCMMMNIPKELYKIGEKFYEIMDDNCHQESASLKIFSRPITDKSVEEHKEVDCLAKSDKCEMHAIPCKTHIAFTRAGVLAFSESKVKGIGTLSTVEEFVDTPSNHSKTQFYSWDDYKKLLIDNRLITSMENPTIHIEIEPDPLIPWDEFLEETESKLDKLNTSKLARIVAQQKETLHNMQLTSNSETNQPWYMKIVELTGIISLGIMITIGLAMGIIKMKNSLVKNKQNIKNITPDPAKLEKGDITIHDLGVSQLKSCTNKKTDETYQVNEKSQENPTKDVKEKITENKQLVDKNTMTDTTKKEKENSLKKRKKMENKELMEKSTMTDTTKKEKENSLKKRRKVDSEENLYQGSLDV